MHQTCGSDCRTIGAERREAQLWQRMIRQEIFANLKACLLTSVNHRTFVRCQMIQLGNPIIQLLLHCVDSIPNHICLLCQLDYLRLQYGVPADLDVTQEIDDL